MIVVSTRETPRQAREVDEHVKPLFQEYDVRLVRPQETEAFAAEVARSAR